MKYKTLKRVLCFLLALVLVASMPLDIHANAVAVAPWAVYALITYMAAVGITFTVTGGVDAMVKAVQDKVDEYEKTVSLPLPIWVVIEEGTKLVPSPSGGGPNWNPNRGKFFFTANATAAITAFITWLVSDGGWSEGSIQNKEVNEIRFFTSNGTNVLSDSKLVYSGWPSTEGIYVLGDTFTYDELLSLSVLTDGGLMTFGQGESDNKLDVFVDGNKVFTTASLPMKLKSYSPFTFCIHHNYTTKNDVVILCGWIKETSGSKYSYSASSLFSASFSVDGVSSLYKYIYNDVASTVETTVPVEIPQLQPSTQQGVYIDTSTDAETLEELAEDIKTQFEETGTIPRPVPEVITDPDYVPQPSPELPTPETPVYPDVEGLGLPALGTLLMTKWPFCIPHDIARVINIFNAPRQTPVWEVNLYEVLGDRVPFAGDTTLRIDLTEFEALGTITRWITLIGWCLTLLLITKQVQDW